jgi:hypothetical protein
LIVTNFDSNDKQEAKIRAQKRKQRINMGAPANFANASEDSQLSTNSAASDLTTITFTNTAAFGKIHGT